MQATRNATHFGHSAATQQSKTAQDFAGRRWLNAVFLALGDVAALSLSLLIASELWGHSLGSRAMPYECPAFVLVAWLIGAAQGRLLPGWGISPPKELERLFKVSLAVAALTAGALLMTGEGQQVSRMTLITGLLLALPALIAGRALTRMVLHSVGWWGVSAVIYGAGTAAQTMVMTLQTFPTYGYRPVAIFDPREELGGTSVSGIPIINAAVQTVVAPVAIMVIPEGRDELDEWLAGPLAPFPVVILLPDLFGKESVQIAPNDFSGMVGLSLSRAQPGRVAQFVKRILDLLLIVLSAPVWIPLCALLAALIWAGDHASPVFRQQRVGRWGQTFTTWKFRTMLPDAEAVLKRKLETDPELRREWKQHYKLRRDPRITRIGAVLRKTSLDELPQLINVLRGEMSLVGPRPLPAYHHEQLSRDSQYLRIRVLPGMTGLWQVSGRSEAGNAGLERYDPYYVRNWSIWLDLFIVLRTVRVVVLGSGAY